MFCYFFLLAVYATNARAEGVFEGIPGRVATDRLTGRSGVTYEMCAGIVDKEGATLKEIAQAEILEECGYDVPIENIEKITACRYVYF